MWNHDKMTPRIGDTSQVVIARRLEASCEYHENPKLWHFTNWKIPQRSSTTIWMKWTCSNISWIQYPFSIRQSSHKCIRFYKYPREKVETLLSWILLPCVESPAIQVFSPSLILAKRQTPRSKVCMNLMIVHQPRFRWDFTWIFAEN